MKRWQQYARWRRRIGFGLECVLGLAKAWHGRQRVFFNLDLNGVHRFLLSIIRVLASSTLEIKYGAKYPPSFCVNLCTASPANPPKLSRKARARSQFFLSMPSALQRIPRLGCSVASKVKELQADTKLTTERPDFSTFVNIRCLCVCYYHGMGLARVEPRYPSGQRLADGRAVGRADGRAGGRSVGGAATRWHRRDKHTRTGEGNEPKSREKSMRAGE